MQLLGSVASPFVRRLRLVLAGQPYQFIALNIFESEGRSVLVKHNPARKVPVLVDAEQTIFDSGVIYRYLAQKLNFKPLSWEQENNLTTINACTDSLVELLLCTRSGFDVNEDKLFFNLQHERIQATLEALEQQIKAGQFGQWDYAAISLYTLIDWILFRDLVDLKPFPVLLQFRSEHLTQPMVAETDPRLS
ncbi:MAG: glutathione S-transferase family protein [Gammaproteobacteria bacterium]|nr:glutathione S-transferase family protein [Gammaproteobacteria bacterium]MBU2057967.1 glutathione S-transferase family protein [Gammaproteobacteria bacterium]MBU2174319.1 glutathione S-transferase family protein [Gammaproteobacteria bacterium]MBU2247730.1 glutathione S-transferase family protein [Gammaproteobacteria bacterium]MBU2344256.1 glutathione S-transferase family protein [Gammaproteobacteria bacterium]